MSYNNFSGIPNCPNNVNDEKESVAPGGRKLCARSVAHTDATPCENVGMSYTGFGGMDPGNGVLMKQVFCTTAPEMKCVGGGRGDGCLGD